MSPICFRRLVVLAVCTILSCACASPDLSGGLWSCATDDDCGGGHQCVAGACRPIGWAPPTDGSAADGGSGTPSPADGSDAADGPLRDDDGRQPDGRAETAVADAGADGGSDGPPDAADAGCADSCPGAGVLRCEAHAVATCRPGPNGCLAWGAAAPCDDENPCTDDVCVGDAGCVSQPVADGTGCGADAVCVAGACSEACRPGDLCDDGDGCTTGDACVAGVCVGQPACDCAADADCLPFEDGDRCNGTLFCDRTAAPFRCAVDPATVVTCDPAGDTTCRQTVCLPANGACVAEDRNEGDACSDGDACTAGDACSGGTCRGGPPPDCDDDDACTEDVCDGGSGCQHVDNGLCACRALALDGRGFERVQAADAPALSGGPAGSLTIEVWVRPDALVGGDGQPILTKVSSATAGDWALYASGANLSFQIRTAGGGPPAAQQALDVLSVGEWTHVAAVVDGADGTLRLYIDGVPSGSPTAWSGTLADTSAPVSVGASPLGPPGFAGAIDDVRIWSVARTGPAIAADFDQLLDGDEEGLAAWWPLDDLASPVGLTSEDRTGHGHDLALSPGSTWSTSPDTAPVPCDGQALRAALLFSEYVGGSADNQAVEVYNAGHVAAPLSDCEVVLYGDGAAGATTRIPLADVLLPPAETWVLCHTRFALGDPGEVCDQFSALDVTGDDAVALYCDGAPLDVIGQLGVDPGSAWAAPGRSTATGTLRRHCDVAAGDPVGEDPFDVAREWSGYPLDDAADLGGHCEPCGGVVCPPATDFAVSCNAQAHCEYAPYVPPGAGASPYGVLIWVPPATFPMGSPDGEGSSAERPQHPVTFSGGYFVDKYEVTGAAFGEGGCADGPDHPVGCVDWFEASAFCRSEGPGFALCSEAEWEQAAKGTAHRLYPWGPANPGDGTRANCSEATCHDGVEGTTSVGAFPAGVSPVGALDLAGNVWEWVEDDWHESYEAGAGAPREGSPWVDGPSRGSSRVVRGGGWWHDEVSMRASNRTEDTPDVRADSVGFRCCATACALLPDRAACPANHRCTASGQCSCITSCGGTCCAQLAGYDVTCNAHGFCEYANANPEAWRAEDVWIGVPPGSFQMGAPVEEADSAPAERPVHQVTFLRGFLVAKYEVTVAQYEACEAASPGTCTPPSTDDGDGQGWGLNRSSNGRSAHPQNGLTWEQAEAVCGWLGGRLPSEAEWEYAAKGPVHRTYPWGETPEPSCAGETAVFNEAGGIPDFGCGAGGTLPVGSMSAGAAWCGALDMAGNVWECVRDGAHSDYVGAPVDGSAWLSSPGSLLVVRGGGFQSVTEYLRSAFRLFDAPGYHLSDRGARCVRDLAP